MNTSVKNTTVEKLQKLVTQRYSDMVADQEEFERKFESRYHRPMSDEDYLAKDDDVEVRVAGDAYLASLARWSMTRQHLQDLQDAAG